MMKYWTEEKLKSAKYDTVIKELKSILKTFHYEYNHKGYPRPISKDVVTALENLVGFSNNT